MNVFQKIKEQRAHEDRVLDFLSQLPEDCRDAAGHIGMGIVFMQNATFDRNMEILTVLRVLHSFELTSYYMNDSCLAIKYDVGEMSVVMFCTDPEYALSKVSNGRCKIVHREHTETGPEVECGI